MKQDQWPLGSDDESEPDPDSLEGWWPATAHADLTACLPKLREYGSDDLVAIGDDLAALMEWHDASDAVKAELGCYFYLRGKTARMHTAYAAHRLPSDDTVHDETVYTMMIRRIRATGSWA